VNKYVSDLLTDQCQRLKHGQCSTRGCLIRGGWTSGPVDYQIATCEAFEAHNELATIDFATLTGFPLRRASYTSKAPVSATGQE
jgi:hypothetical protein